MSNVQRITIQKGEITYQEIIRFISDEDQEAGNAPIESGYSILLDPQYGKPSQRISEITDLALENEATAKKRVGIFYSFLAGAMLYPILSIADMGKMEGGNWATIYVYEDEGIPIT